MINYEDIWFISSCSQDHLKRNNDTFKFFLLSCFLKRYSFKVFDGVGHGKFAHCHDCRVHRLVDDRCVVQPDTGDLNNPPKKFRGKLPKITRFMSQFLIWVVEIVPVF